MVITANSTTRVYFEVSLGRLEENILKSHPLVITVAVVAIVLLLLVLLLPLMLW